MKTAECMELSQRNVLCGRLPKWMLAAKAANMTCMAFYNPDSGKDLVCLASVVVEGFEEIDKNCMEKSIVTNSHHILHWFVETPRLLIRNEKKKIFPI